MCLEIIGKKFRGKNNMQIRKIKTVTFREKSNFGFWFLLKVDSEHAFSLFKCFFRTNFWSRFIWKSKLFFNSKKRKTPGEGLEEDVSVDVRASASFRLQVPSDSNF